MLVMAVAMAQHLNDANATDVEVTLMWCQPNK